MHLHSVNTFKTNTCNPTYSDVSLNLVIIYTHHHSGGSCTSGCCKLFQTLFVWAFILQVIMFSVNVGSGHARLHIGTHVSS